MPARLTRTILWLIFSATPLGLLTGVFLSHDVMPKVVLLLLGAAFALCLLPQWLDGLRQLRATQPGRWFLRLLFAQALLLIVSTVFSTQPLLSFAGTSWRRFGMAEQLAILALACALASCSAMRQDFTPALWRAVVLCGGLASIYGISQYLGRDPFLDRRLYTIDYLGAVLRPPATMGHAIYFSAYLVPVALLAAWRAGVDEFRLWRSAHALVAALAPLAILLSGSRGALLGLAVGWAVLIALRRPSRTLLAACALAALAAAAAVAFLPAGANLRHRMAQWREDPGSARLAVWRDSPALIAQAPLLGSGPDTFATAFRAVESAQLSRAYPDFYLETPHNAFIDAACSQGVSGPCILLCVFAFGFSPFGLQRDARSGLRAAMAGMFVCALFDSFSLVSALYLWGIAGILAACEPPSPAAPKSASPAPTPAARIPVAMATFGILSGAVLVTAAILLSVQDAAYADLGRKVDAGDLPGARQALRRATSFGIGLPGYELWSSRQMSRLAAWSDAKTAAALAVARGEDRLGAAFQSSVLELATGDAPRAEALARDAIALAPNWYKPHLLRAQILQAMGRNQEAEQEARTSLNLGWKGR